MRRRRRRRKEEEEEKNNSDKIEQPSPGRWGMKVIYIYIPRFLPYVVGHPLR